MMLLGAPVSAQEATPPIRKQNQAQGDVTDVYQVPAGAIPVRAVVVKSWNDGRAASAWRELNAEWPMYGTRPITIDTTTLLSGSFSYADLVNSGADVIILSDPAGGLMQYSTEEVNAVARYTSEGHNVITTYVAFVWATIDNRGLAPNFGLRPDLAYDSTGISNIFNMITGCECLFTGIPPPSWTSSGYPYTQAPAGTLQWTDDTLAGAMVVADSDNHTAIASIYDGGTYSAIYISNMPEFFGSTVDKQLLYNALTCYVR
jgi:hypothetical protein